MPNLHKVFQNLEKERTLLSGENGVPQKYMSNLQPLYL